MEADSSTLQLLTHLASVNLIQLLFELNEVIRLLTRYLGTIQARYILIRKNRSKSIEESMYREKKGSPRTIRRKSGKGLSLLSAKMAQPDFCGRQNGSSRPNLSLLARPSSDRNPLIV